MAAEQSKNTYCYRCRHRPHRTGLTITQHNEQDPARQLALSAVTAEHTEVFRKVEIVCRDCRGWVLTHPRRTSAVNRSQQEPGHSQQDCSAKQGWIFGPPGRAVHPTVSRARTGRQATASLAPAGSKTGSQRLQATIPGVLVLPQDDGSTCVNTCTMSAQTAQHRSRIKPAPRSVCDRPENRDMAEQAGCRVPTRNRSAALIE